MYDFFVPLAIYGFGLGLTMSPTTTCAMATLKRDQLGVGSGILNFSKLLNASIGVVIMQVLLTRREIYHAQILTTTLDVSHDSFSLYQLIAALQMQNFFGGSFDVALGSQLWFNGMNILPEKYASFMQYLNQIISSQSAILAFQDDFFVLFCCSIIGVLITLFLKNTH